MAGQLPTFDPASFHINLIFICWIPFVGLVPFLIVL